jgi:Common central domain of tyrosinase
MGTMASPNDPVFFLHHANVDRLCAKWQAQHGDPDYQPAAGGPMARTRTTRSIRWTLSMIAENYARRLELLFPNVAYRSASVLDLHTPAKAASGTGA